MVLDGNFELFQDDSLNKQLKIEYDNGTITNEDIHSEQFELKESLCSEDTLRFGCCETGSIKFKISNIFEPLKDKWLTVSMTLEGNREEPFAIGQYKVVSDVPTANRKYREVTAYDAMYDINNAEVSQWYNTLLPNKDSTTTLKAFRDSFFNYLGIEQEEIELPNDGMTVEKTIEPSELSGQTVITCICEINGCFGHIGRNGKFQYIFLEPIYKGLYPRDDLFPSNDIYPSDEHGTTKIRGSHYISAEYQDFETKIISRLIIRQEENDIGGGYGTGDNIYVIQDNFLVYGKSTADIDHIAELIMGKIDQIWYRPMSVYAKGNPGFEVGDGIRVNTNREILYTYVLTRTLKGVQSLKDTYAADGKEYQAQQVNTTRNSIIQLRGKANLLTRTVEENRLEVIDITNGLSSRITQNANSITAEVTRASTAEGNLSTRITQNAESITAEVTRATKQEGTLSASITVNANAIAQRVVKGTVSSEISQEAGKINIKANRISISSSYFTLTEDGHITATGGTIAGNNISASAISAANGNWSINSNGSATFKNVTITGVQAGSTFGSIGYNSSGITYGSFGGASYFSPSVSNPFGGQAVTQIESLAVNKIYADYIQGIQADINTINANYISANEVSANYATISSLNAVDGKFSNLNASNITAGTLSVNHFDVDGLVNTVFPTLAITMARLAVLQYLNAGQLAISGTEYGPKEIKDGNGNNVTVLAKKS